MRRPTPVCRRAKGPFTNVSWRALSQRAPAAQLHVEAVEPPRRFAFRWVSRPGLILCNNNSLLVEFILEPENGSTRLRVVESGFDAIDWSDEEKAKYAEEHANGWQRCLGLLRNLAKTKPAERK